MGRKRYIFAQDKKTRFGSPKFIYLGILALGSLGAGSWAFWQYSPQAQTTIGLQSQKPVTSLEPILAAQITSWQQAAKNILFTESVPQEFQQKALKEISLLKKDKIIALTFDDGPWPVTTIQILDILKQEKIKATFFLLGQPLQNYPQIAQQVVAQGHAIGNHTWHHWYHKLDATTSAKEIETTAALIYKTTGIKTYLFRPPGGLLNNGVADYAKRKKYFVALWSSDSTDYNRPSVATLVNNVMKNARPGGMVLMHDGGGDRSHTVKALPIIIAQLKSRGYKFVTVPELLEIADTETKTQVSTKVGTSQ
ncbi:polysaccharide deacetylase family protein [Merismopedia glauca]|uniref:polysaccharide deacetylase family protein n=1 Tax=Merismopedia glauca TaxID=292586 RepID=UPI001C632706|nr:polysaccharide deacetylase family protein [Merismopedia glauca]